MTTPSNATAATDLEPALSGWRGRPAWCRVHTAFGDGGDFLRTWAAWRADAQRPRMLHYVALWPDALVWPDSAQALLAAGTTAPVTDEASLRQLLQYSAAHWGPGQHRLGFAAGQVLLTLCIGPLVECLRQQQFEADEVCMAAPAPPNGAAPHVPNEATQAGAPHVWSEWAVKALLRCCRRGTRVLLAAPLARAQPLLVAWLRQYGVTEQGVYDPRWPIKTTREHWRQARLAWPAAALEPAEAAATEPCVAVVGAGLAGASVAAALARRGWRVRVLDQGVAAAAGASGLPVGLVAPYVSADDSVLARLTRSGSRLCLQQAAQWLRAGEDWAQSGVQEQRFAASGELPLAPRWHAQAGWIKPAALVRAWLAQPGIDLQLAVAVADVRRNPAGWSLHDASGAEICRARRVVLANAGGALPLLQRMAQQQPELAQACARLPAVQGVHGLVSWGQHTAPELRPFPDAPHNGSGSLIPHIPMDGGRHWFVGASYQPHSASHPAPHPPPQWPDAHKHQANWQRLARLLPALAGALQAEFAGAGVHAAAAVHAWTGTRCVSADRLPLLGSVLPDDPGVWICAAMGSRGLSLAPLCAELLAAQWAGEPLPLEAALAQVLLARRKGLS